MSSRILQQDSDSLLTQNNEFIINENFIAANSIVTGSPVVGSTGITQDHNIAPTNISTGASVVSTASITQDHNIDPTSISTGASVVSTTGITQDHNIAPSGITSGQPVVSTSAITQVHDLAASGIASGQPVVATSGITQDHNLSTVGVIAGQVVISTAGLIQNHSLQANDLVTGNPIVPSVDATELENFTVAPVTTGTPTVGQPSFAQVHNIGLADVVTSSPIVQSADDPNAIIRAEIEEIQQMFGGWNRRIYEVPDGRLVQAEREIKSTFGDTVSIDKKAKSLLKFGKSAELSADTIETVWSYGGHEVYVQDNLIDSISSSNAVDNEEIYLECHTVEGTGADQQFTFMTQTVNLNGQTRVALPTPVARVSKAYNNNGTELVGNVYVYQNTALVAGVPQDSTKVHAHIPQGFQQSFKGATTFSNEDYYVLTGGFGSVSNKQAASVDFYLEVRTPGKVFRQGAAVSAGSAGGSWDIDLDPCIIIPKNADIRITCETATQGAVVFGSFKGYLAKVTG